MVSVLSNVRSTNPTHCVGHTPIEMEQCDSHHSNVTFVHFSLCIPSKRAPTNPSEIHSVTLIKKVRWHSSRMARIKKQSPSVNCSQEEVRLPHGQEDMPKQSLGEKAFGQCCPCQRAALAWQRSQDQCHQVDALNALSDCCFE